MLRVLLALVALSSTLADVTDYTYDHASVRRVKRDFGNEEWSESLPMDVTEDPDVMSEHTYYTMKVFANRTDLIPDYFVDVREWLKSGPSVNGSENHEHLDGSYRKAAGANIGFEFPFYGHEIENLTIATGGFIYVGDQTHSWLAATQYIAPLMANFDTVADNATIMFATNGSRMVITWDQVRLRDNTEAGTWTFQVSLFKNGDIWFVYKDIPIPVTSISDNNHPCKLGISDAYLFTHQYGDKVKTLLGPIQTKRVIHEYHRIAVAADKISNDTVVVLEALPTCLQFKSCEECQSGRLKNFNCSWCAPKQQDVQPFCSDYAGLHRRRQHWVEGECARNDPTENQCKISTSTPATDKVTSTEAAVTAPALDIEEFHKQSLEKGRTAGPGRAMLAIFFLLLLCGAGWCLYAYFNPHTPSGQMLIKYRPSKWQIPSSHVRYSASVHM